MFDVSTLHERKKVLSLNKLERLESIAPNRKFDNICDIIYHRQNNRRFDACIHI